jgi:ATPase subunit of ABC transporter with duplicated ATPase domains
MPIFSLTPQCNLFNPYTQFNRRYSIFTFLKMGKTYMALSDADNGKPAVRFEQIEKSFDGETLVIKDLNLEIAQGEFLTMLGPPGKRQH